MIGLIKSLPGHAFRAGKLHPWITRIVCTWNRDKNLGMEKYTISSISGKNSTNQEKRLLIGGTYANVRSWDIRAKKQLRLFDRVHKDSKWQKLVSRGHYKDYWFIYLWGSFVETISLFTGGGEKGGRGRVGVRFMGRVVQHSSQILAFHLTSGGDKSPQPQQVQTLTFQPGCFIAGPTVVCARFFADYLELFPFPLLGNGCLSFWRWQLLLLWPHSLFTFSDWWSEFYSLYISFHIFHLHHFLLGDKIQISFVKSSIGCQRDPNQLLTILTFLTLSLSTTDAIKVLLRIRLWKS